MRKKNDQRKRRRKRNTKNKLLWTCKDTSTEQSRNDNNKWKSFNSHSSDMSLNLYWSGNLCSNQKQHSIRGRRSTEKQNANRLFLALTFYFFFIVKNINILFELFWFHPFWPAIIYIIQQSAFDFFLPFVFVALHYTRTRSLSKHCFILSHIC